MKHNRILENFMFSYDAMFAKHKVGNDKRVCAYYLANSYLQFFSASEFRSFLGKFIVEYNHEFEIVDKLEHLRMDVSLFIGDLTNSTLNIIIEDYPNTYKMLYNIIKGKDIEFYEEIETEYKKLLNASRLFSYSEIVQNPEYDISLNTLKSYIKKLDVHIYEKRRGKKGKYIANNSLKRILKEKHRVSGNDITI